MLYLSAILNISDGDLDAPQMGLSKPERAKLLSRGATKDGEKIDHSIIKADKKLSDVESKTSVNSVVGKPLTKDSLPTANRQMKGGKVVKGSSPKVKSANNVVKSIERVNKGESLINGKLGYQVSKQGDDKYRIAETNRSAPHSIVNGSELKTFMQKAVENGRKTKPSPISSLMANAAAFVPETLAKKSVGAIAKTKESSKQQPKYIQGSILLGSQRSERKHEAVRKSLTGAKTTFAPTKSKNSAKTGYYTFENTPENIAKFRGMGGSVSKNQKGATSRELGDA